MSREVLQKRKVFGQLHPHRQYNKGEKTFILVWRHDQLLERAHQFLKAYEEGVPMVEETYWLNEDVEKGLGYLSHSPAKKFVKVRSKKAAAREA